MIMYFAYRWEQRHHSSHHYQDNRGSGRECLSKVFSSYFHYINDYVDFSPTDKNDNTTRLIITRTNGRAPRFVLRVK